MEDRYKEAAKTNGRGTAARVQAALESQLAAVTENTSAVNSLQATVTDMKKVNATVVSSLSDETAKLKKAIDNPSALHYKAVTLAPNGFVAAETVWRSKATGGDIATAFNAIPYEHADAYSLSEFYGSARQSRVGLMVEGKPGWGTLRGYWFRGCFNFRVNVSSSILERNRWESIKS